MCTSEQLSSPSQSTRSRDTSNHDFNKLVCCFYFKTDTENNFAAVGTFHATKNKFDINHVSNLTEKWKTMAAKLGYGELLSPLSSGDISNELYYHKSTLKNYYIQFCNEYKQASKTSDENEANSKWLKALALNIIIYYVIETGRSNNVKSFKVKDLEEMYNTICIQFIASGTILRKVLVNNNVVVVFKDAIDEIIHKSSIELNAFLRSSNVVVLPIRDKM